VQLLGGDGQLVAELRGVVCQAVGSAPPQRRHRDDLLYHYRWIPRPLQSEGNGCGEMPDPEQIAAIVQPEFSGWAESAQRRRYYEQLKPAMADLCVVYLLEMLDRLGHPLLAGERISTLALTDELGIATQHTKLFGRMIQILAEAGVLAASDGDWVVVGRQERLSATALWRSLFERWPGFLAELTLLRRCGERLRADSRSCLSGLADGFFAQSRSGARDTERAGAPARRSARPDPRDRCGHRRIYRPYSSGAASGSFTICFHGCLSTVPVRRGAEVSAVSIRRVPQARY